VSAPTGPVRQWNHDRKGRLVGQLVSEIDEWMDIYLVDYDETITVRKSFCTEVVA
jgi:hypothetical protein